MSRMRKFLISCCVLPLAVFCDSALATDDADFTLPDLGGQLHSLSDYRGKWVLVNYWATWCPPCLEELPELEAFHTESAGKAVVLGVNMESIGHAELQGFVADRSLTFPILVAGARPDGDQLLGPVDGMPTSYLVTPQGKIVARQVGQVTAEAIGGFIDRYENADEGGGT